jgi:hypothetical protein
MNERETVIKDELVCSGFSFSLYHLLGKLHSHSVLSFLIVHRPSELGLGTKKTSSQPVALFLSFPKEKKDRNSSSAMRV